MNYRIHPKTKRGKWVVAHDAENYPWAVISPLGAVSYRSPSRAGALAFAHARAIGHDYATAYDAATEKEAQAAT